MEIHVMVGTESVVVTQMHRLTMLGLLLALLGTHLKELEGLLRYTWQCPLSPGLSLPAILGVAALTYICPLFSDSPLLAVPYSLPSRIPRESVPCGKWESLATFEILFHV
jgi:hypothetical protein